MVFMAWVVAVVVVVGKTVAREFRSVEFYEIHVMLRVENC